LKLSGERTGVKELIVGVKPKIEPLNIRLPNEQKHTIIFEGDMKVRHVIEKLCIKRPEMSLDKFKVEDLQGTAIDLDLPLKEIKWKVDETKEICFYTPITPKGNVNKQENIGETLTEAKKGTKQNEIKKEETNREESTKKEGNGEVDGRSEEGVRDNTKKDNNLLKESSHRNRSNSKRKVESKQEENPTVATIKEETKTEKREESKNEIITKEMYDKLTEENEKLRSLNSKLRKRNKELERELQELKEHLPTTN